MYSGVVVRQSFGDPGPFLRPHTAVSCARTQRHCASLASSSLVCVGGGPPSLDMGSAYARCTVRQLHGDCDGGVNQPGLRGPVLHAGRRVVPDRELRRPFLRGILARVLPG